MSKNLNKILATVIAGGVGLSTAKVVTTIGERNKDLKIEQQKITLDESNANYVDAYAEQDYVLSIDENILNMLEKENHVSRHVKEEQEEPQLEM
jgi:hypothetical protein